VPIEQVAVYSSRRQCDFSAGFRRYSLSRYRLDDALNAMRTKHRRQIETQRGGEVGGRRTGDGWNGAVRWTARRSIGRHFVLATGKLGLRGVDDARDGSLVG